MDGSIVRRIGGVATLVLTGAAAYFCFWPVPADPRSWSAPTPPGYVGAHLANTRLAGLRTIDIGNEFGPEHIAIGPDGKLYAAMTSGSLLRMDPDGGGQEVFANTGGRVLGFDFDAEGRMIAADAMKGLLAITPDARVTVLTDRVSATDPIRYANSIVVAPDGVIFFTDASGRFAPREWGGTYEASVLDILEQAATGRVLAYDPATTSTRVVAHGFSFANGIALSSDGQSLFVSETGRYRIWKIDGRARDLDVRSGSPQAQSVARQSAWLSGQSDARTRWPHLGRAVQTAQPGGGWTRAAPVPAQGPAPAAAVSPAAGRSVRACLRVRRGRPRHRRLAGSQRRLS